MFHVERDRPRAGRSGVPSRARRCCVARLACRSSAPRRPLPPSPRADERERTARSRRVGSSTRPAPHVTTSTSRQPWESRSLRAACNSSRIREPRSASMTPPGRVIGSSTAPSCAKGATARATDTSKTRRGGRSAKSGARPRTTVTCSSRPSCATTSPRNRHLRSIGSSRVTRRSGRASARGIPGRPAPLPTSTTSGGWPGEPAASGAAAGMASASTAQLRRCRSHSRPVSRGPIRPRSTPAVASSSEYRTASGRRAPKTVAAADGTGSTPPVSPSLPSLPSLPAGPLPRPLSRPPAPRALSEVSGPS